jgi:protein associated with RNAse G/E
MSDGIRIRGIYTTALTERFESCGEIVQASAPIEDRFDSSFAAGPAGATVETTDDGLGVGITGEPGLVDELATVAAGLALDGFRYDDDLPRGGIFDGTVTDTTSGGAIVDVGLDEVFLPYSEADDYVDDGDDLRVQVTEPTPPWSDDDTVATTELQVAGNLCTLYRGESSGSGPSPGAANLVDLISTDVPDGWRVSWAQSADDVSFDALDDALSLAATQAATIDDALADTATDGKRRLCTPEATSWVWYGRESRFALDELRGQVTTTMPGHHRIKAGSRDASAAVDFVEALCDLPSDDDADFPFDVVTRQFGPVEGDRLAIDHGKPDGRCFRLGRGEVTARDPDGKITLRREMTSSGVYDGLGTEREPGDEAITKFTEGRWWYPTVYRGEDGARKGTYVNICTPVEVFPEAVRYVDLHVDVLKYPDGTTERVDEEELAAAVEAGHVSADLAEKARTVATAVENAL